MKFIRKSLLAQLVTYFVLLSVMIASLVGYIAFVQARNTLQQTVFEQLEASATLKDDELNRWIADQREAVLLIASIPEAQIQAEKLLQPASNSDYREAYTSLSEYLDKVISRNSNIQELFIIRVSDGEAILSTNTSNEGTQHANAEYFIQGQWGPSIQSINVSAETGKPTMTIATPLLNNVGLQLGGVLVAELNLERMEKIILKRAGLGETGQTYLVDISNTLVSAESFGEQEFPQTVTSAGIEAAIQGVDSSGLYLNYEGVPVIGAYRWIGQWEVALLVEMNQQEAFAPAARLAQVILLVGLISAAALTLGVFLLARQVTRPILSISDTAIQISEGDLDRVVEVKREDEVGVLAQTFNSMTAQLRELVGSLEQRVEERTAELKESTKQSEKRAAQLDAIAQVAREISTSQDLEILLPKITNVISQQFGFYHVGIFLLDENREFAVLRAANSSGGQKMLKRKHQLKVGETGIVGFVTNQGEARIALDTGADAIYFDNPDLPDTRSEMALPLTISNQIIGALDVQSLEPDAFSQEDVNTLATLADQVAIAIQNARLYEETQKALAQSQTLIQQFTQKGWSEFKRTQKLTGIRRSKAKATLLKEHLATDDLNGENALNLPINLRGQKIGTLKVSAPDKHEWTQDEIDIATSIIERAAIAMENARLLEDAQQRATRERVIGDISASISTFSDMEGILRTAVQQLGRRMGGADVVLELGADLEAEETAK